MTKRFLALLTFLLTAPVSAHNLHVSHARMVVEGDLVTLRVRFFRHDLESALQVFYESDGVTLEPTSESDSLFLGYFSGHFVLTVSDGSLQPIITRSGEDGEIWWYELQFKSGGKIRQVSLINSLLFDVFDDQKNLLSLVHLPDRQLESLYFVRGSSRYDIAFSAQ